MRHIEDAIYEIVGEDIQKQKKGVVAPIFLALAGVVLLGINFSIGAIEDNANLNSILLVVGATLFFSGLIIVLARVFGSSRIPVYMPTGEKFEQIGLCFEDSMRSKVDAAVKCCDLAALQAIPQVESAPMMVQVFATSSRSMVAMQIQRYVPHNYEPVSEVFFKSKR